MIKLIVSTAVVAVVASSFLIANFAGATNVEGNRGSIVKVSGSCSDMLANASNNRGSIIKIDGNHTCTVEEIIGDGSVVNDNRGSIIKIDNVCGDTSKITAANNRGSIVKVTASKNCTTGKPTTVVVEKPAAEQPKSEQPKVVVSEDSELPAELPQTGQGNVLLSTGLTSLIGFGVVSLLRRRS